MLNTVLRLKIIEHFGKQSDFALALNSRDAFVSRVLNGREQLNDQQKTLWSKKLETPVDELFTTGSEAV